jgi:hypothetical protein
LSSTSKTFISSSRANNKEETKFTIKLGNHSSSLHNPSQLNHIERLNRALPSESAYVFLLFLFLFRQILTGLTLVSPFLKVTKNFSPFSNKCRQSQISKGFQKKRKKNHKKVYKILLS